MAEHRPTYGSRLRAWRRRTGPLVCVCGDLWTAQHEAEAGREWQGGRPVPDGAGQQPLPIDIIGTRDGGFHQIGQVDKRGNRGPCR